jgi:hypothetical protein
LHAPIFSIIDAAEGRTHPTGSLEPAIISSGMTVQDVRNVLRSSEWQALESRNNQTIFLCEFPEFDTTYRLSTEDLANIFNIRADNVPQIRDRAYMKKKHPHRRLTLDPEQEAGVVRFIRERSGWQNYVT